MRRNDERPGAPENTPGRPMEAEVAPIVAQEETALAPQSESSVALMFERLASNPDVDVAKLERLIAMQERILAHNATSEFNAAFAEMQAEIPSIVERGKTDKGKYALIEDIADAVKPILQRHGFSLAFRTAWPDKGTVLVTGMLTHKGGHCRESQFLSAADSSGSKNAIQGLGSAITYGRRYTTKDLLNITSREEDDDGAAAGKKEAPKPPTGFQAWMDDITATADNGLKVFGKAWNESKPEFRTYATRHHNREMTALKVKATKAAAS